MLFYSILYASAVLWSGEPVYGLDECVCENPVMTLPIKKRISTELFINRTEALYIGVIWIRIKTSEDDQPVALVDLRS